MVLPEVGAAALWGDEAAAAEAAGVPTVVDAAAWNPKAASDHRVAVIANVSKLQEAQIKALEDFVRDGGGLLVFPGNRVDAAWWNARLAGASGAGKGA